MSPEFDVNIEDHRLAIHEAGHAVCGYILGGIIHWSAIGLVGTGAFPEENDDTLGSTRCEFAKPWLDEKLTEDAELIARLVFCANSIRQAYAGVVAETVIFGTQPIEGHKGDFADVIRLLQFSFTLCRLTFDPAIANPFDAYLRNETMKLLSDPPIVSAVKEVASVLLEKRRIEGDEAMKLLSVTLPVSR